MKKSKMKKSYKERLQNKTVKELKAIYKRRNGVDLLRGSKSEMINTLVMNLKAPSDWKIISNN